MDCCFSFVLSVLRRYTDSDFPFSIFKLFFPKMYLKRVFGYILYFHWHVILNKTWLYHFAEKNAYCYLAVEKTMNCTKSTPANAAADDELYMSHRTSHCWGNSSLKVWYLVKWGLIKGRNSCLAYSELLFWLYVWQEQDYTCICKRWHWDGHGDGCFQISKHFALQQAINDH